MRPVLPSGSVLVVMLLFLHTITYQQVPPRDRPEQKLGTARIGGRVVAGDTGVPQREAAVLLASRELGEPRRTTTDAEGRYAFADLPAGRYVLTVVPSRFRTAYLGTAMPWTGSRGEIVELADGQQIRNLDVPLERAAAISGRVVDEFGEPMANVRVNALSSEPGGASRSAGAGLPLSDDRGRFRVFGLEPGQYYLKAEAPGQSRAVAGDSADEGYLPTYYPGTANATEAPLLTLERGQELGELEIRLVRSRTYRISGLVLGSDGRPAPEVQVMVTEQHEGGGMRGFGHQTKADGTFEIVNLPPGEYVLAALPRGAGGRDAAEASAPVRVAISGADVENLTLVMTPGITLRGQIVTDEGAVPPFAPRSLRVTAMAEHPAMMSSTRAEGEVHEDWTFEIDHVRAPVVIRPAGSLGRGWRTKAVFYRGIEITDDFTEFRDSTTTRELQMVIGNRGATLTGVVTDAAGRPAVQRSVVLFPAEPERRSTRSLGFRLARTDESGRYTIDVLPSGDYLAAATDTAFGFTPQSDRQAFDWLVPFARRVSLQGYEEKTLDLRLGESKR